MKDKAEQFGWTSLYESNDDFRQIFDELYLVVESLPDSLISRGRALAFPQLHTACVEGDVELVEALLKGGISPDSYPCTEDEDDEPPLVWLANKPEMDLSLKLKVASLLLQYGADPEEGNAMQVAEENDDEEFLEFIRDQINEGDG